MHDSDTLHVAVMNGRVDILHRLSGSGADVDRIGVECSALDRLGEMVRSGLHFAVNGGREELIRLFAQKWGRSSAKGYAGEDGALESKRKGGCGYYFSIE